MDFVLVMVAPVVGFFVLAKVLGDRPMPHLGPWLAMICGIWGACTQKPLTPLERYDFPSIAVGIAFLAVTWVFGTVVWRGGLKVGSEAYLPLGLWYVTCEIAYPLGTAAVAAIVAKEPMSIVEPPTLFLLIGFVVMGGAASYTSSSGG